jgi:excisionase family DNA binding protein
MQYESARHAPSTATYLRSAEVAAILQVSPKTIARWAQQGRLPYQRTLGGHRRYPEPAIRQSAVECQWGQVAGMDLPPAGAVQQPGRAFGPLQRLGGDQPVPGEPREQPADQLAMGAQRGVAQPPIPEQLQDLAGVAIHAQGSDGFDPQEAVTRERLDGLLAPHGRAAENLLDRVVLQAQHQPLGLVKPGGRQGPSHVRAVPAPLDTGVAVPDQERDHASAAPR